MIVKLDDIGLHMAQRGNRAAQAFGGFLVRMVPGLLKSLSTIGTAAMLWVGGGILLHGIEDLGFEKFPHVVHDTANSIAAAFGPIEGIVAWIANAIAAAIVGAVVGTIIVVIVRQFTSRPDKLVVDNPH